MYSLRQAKLDVYDVPKIAICLLLGIFYYLFLLLDLIRDTYLVRFRVKKHLIQNGFMNFTTICDTQLDFLVID